MSLRGTEVVLLIKALSERKRTSIDGSIESRTASRVVSMALEFCHTMYELTIRAMRAMIPPNHAAFVAGRVLNQEKDLSGVTFLTPFVQMAHNV
ncbi:hypothetical protein D4R75_11420 [bacterium]|nr:MAG: hypothetical protein D4R75_11420 [bacterium]